MATLSRMSVEALVDRANKGSDPSVEQLERHRHGWTDLSQYARTPMQYYGWARAAAEVFDRDARLVVPTVYDGDDLAAATAFHSFSDSGDLRWPGAEELGEPVDFAYRDLEALERLCETVVGLQEIVVLDRVLAESPTVNLLKRAFRFRGALVVRPALNYPTILLDPSWEEPERHLNAGRRSDLRRARRRAEQLGSVTFDARAPGPDEVVELLTEAFRIEASGWKAREGTAMQVDISGHFFRSYLQLAAQHEAVRANFLRINDQAVAVQLGLVCGNRFWLLKIGYDEQFKPCSPGTLLLRESARQAALQGLESYELMGRVDSWTKVWTNDERPCVSIHAYPVHLKSLSQLGSRSLRYFARKIRPRRHSEDRMT